MNPSHRRYLVNELIRGISDIGPQFESFGQQVANYLIDEPLKHRGLNAQGLPVGNTIDSYSANGEIAAEYSADKSYFDRPFKKLLGDYQHVRTNHPQAKDIYLLAAQECGPKLGTRLTNIRHWLQKRSGITVEVYDSRRIAEFIVDELLLNDEAIETLASILGPLQRVRDEYAATNLVPAQSDNYVRQDNVINDIVSRIHRDRVAAIAGVSGSGKSENAVTVSTVLAGKFEIVIWVVATELRDLTELQGLDVERRGRRVNVVTLLKERSCLLILDDLRLKLTLDQLSTYTNDTSAILVTRQIAQEGDYRLPALSDADAETVLQNGIADACPAHIKAKVRETAGGHPLALRLMNAAVRESSWDDLYADCEAIGEFDDDTGLQRLADRLLSRLLPRLSKELSLFVWSASGRIDRSFARRAILPVGVRKLEESCLLSADRHDVIRLHEIVYASLGSLAIDSNSYAGDFEQRIDEHINHLAFEAGEALNFLNFCEIHQGLLERLLAANPRRSTCLYCIAHAWSDEDIDISVLPSPLDLCTEIETRKASSDIDVSALCEVIESLYRRAKIDRGLEGARETLSENLELYSRVADTVGVSPIGRRTALHHKSKTLRNLQRFDEAEQLCENVLSEFDSPATKLLFARLLLHGSQEKIARAGTLLLEILEEAKTKPEEAEISVVLAAIETLGRWQLSKSLPNAIPDALDKYGRLVADFITSSAARGFDLAFVAFAAIGRKLRYHDEPLFFEVLSALPDAGPEDARDDKERAAWGDILLSASDARGIDESEKYATAALEFYDSLAAQSSYILQQKGHCLLQLKRPAEARDVLRSAIANISNPWSLYWLSKAELALGEYDESLKLIDQAISDQRSERYLSAFLEHRFEVRNKLGDADAVSDLKAAHDQCTDPKHQGSIAKKLTYLQS